MNANSDMHRRDAEKRSFRWIKVAHVRRNHFIRYFNWGVPGGVLVYWTGSKWWQEPRAYFGTDFPRVVESHLRPHGLSVVEHGPDRPVDGPDGLVEVWVKVQRAKWAPPLKRAVPWMSVVLE